MAGTPIRIGPDLVPSVAETVYTAPAGGAVVRWVNVANPTGTAATFTLSAGVDAAGTRVIAAQSVVAGGRLIDYPYLELGNAEVLQMSSGTNDVLVLTAGGVEL